MDDATLRVLLGVALVWSALFFLAFRDEIAAWWRESVRRSTHGQHAHRGGRR